ALEAMLRRASRMAENMFECDGEVSLLARRDGGLEKLPRQGGHPSDRTAARHRLARRRRTVVLPDPLRLMGTLAPLANGRRSRNEVSTMDKAVNKALDRLRRPDARLVLTYVNDAAPSPAARISSCPAAIASWTRPHSNYSSVVMCSLLIAGCCPVTRRAG